jgi:Tfp pilus assembly protein PilW
MLKSLKTAMGFTLVELMVGVAISGFILLGLAQMYRTSVWSYNLQSQTTEMHQNAQYTVKRLSEELMQMGADLPDTNWSVTGIPAGRKDSIALHVNPYGASYRIPADMNVRKIPMEDGSAFKPVKRLVWQKNDFSTQTLVVDSVDTAHNPDTLFLHASQSFVSGDGLYADSIVRFFRRGDSLCMNTSTNVLAEGIDSLAMVFYTSSGTATTTWANMNSGSVYVRTRTAKPDRSYRHPVFNDGYRRLALSMKFRLRNKH